MAAAHAGTYLRALLEESDHHRRRWAAHVARDHGGLSTAAVCRVLAGHLWEAGERPESVVDLPRRLRDLVGRALSGEVLTNETARWFVEAFELGPDERSRLLTELARPADDGAPAVPGPGPAAVRGLYAHVHHTVGPSGDVVRSEHVRVLEVAAAEAVAPVGRVAEGSRLELGPDLRVVAPGAAGGTVLLCGQTGRDDVRQVVRWATESAPRSTNQPSGGPRHVDVLDDLPCDVVVVTITFEAAAPPWVEIGVRASDDDASEIHIAMPDEHGVVARVFSGQRTVAIDYAWLQPAGVSARSRTELRAAG